MPHPSVLTMKIVTFRPTKRCRCCADPYLGGKILLGLLLASLLLGGSDARAANFTTGTESAVKYGVHEIVLEGDGNVENPLDTIVTVTFTPPSGAAASKTVWAFYDGENTWRARVYVSETGEWQWTSTCDTDSALTGKSGTFPCATSHLRGRLLPHPKNSRHWMTEDGQWFLNVVDTAYFLLGFQDELGDRIPEDDFQAYVRDAVDQGITSFMAYLIPGPGSWDEEGSWTENYFADPEFSKLRLENFRFSDRRLRWLLEHFPDVGLELILFPRGVGYARDEQFWKQLDSRQKERLLRYVVARFAAYPQAYWLVSNDTHYGKKYPNNNALVREVGKFFEQHDPWRHPLSTGHARRVDFAFADETWATFIHLENAYDLGAGECDKYQRFGKPVLLGEDRYEHYRPNALDPIDMQYYQRRLYWAWLLSGGAANYGGRWWVLHPYSQTGQRETANPDPSLQNVIHSTPLVGLNSVRFIRDYFQQRGIELSDFEPDHIMASDQDGGHPTRAPKLMRRGREEFIMYHPNAAADGREATVDANRTAGLRLNLKEAPGSFALEWYRAQDGETRDAGIVEGGREISLVAPWSGHDVLLRLSRKP